MELKEKSLLKCKRLKGLLISEDLEGILVRITAAMGPTANEEDLVKYAFALFLNHDFAKSLEVANMGLKKNPRHAAFNRLAMEEEIRSETPS